MKASTLEKRTDWKERLIGFEFENPLAHENGEPVSFEEMQRFWKSCEAAGWRVTMDPLFKIYAGAEKSYKGQKVPMSSDSAAGNLEISFPPFPSIAEAKACFDEVQKDVQKILKKQHLSMLGLGSQPGHFPMPLENYRVKSMLFEGFGGSLGQIRRVSNATMTPNSAHQANVSVRPREMIRQVNNLIKATGLIVALCANSPIQNWEILPWKEWRMASWYLRFMGEKPGFGKLARFPKHPFRSFADFYLYAWDTPAMILPPLRDGLFYFPDQKINYVNYFSREGVSAHNLSGEKLTLIPSVDDINFAMLCQWMFAKPHLVLDPEKTSVSDFYEHLQKDSLEDYLEDRLLNCYLEYRGSAAAPRGEETALPSLIMGLIQNPVGCEEVLDRFSWEEAEKLIFQCAVHGLAATVGGNSILPLLRDLLVSAEEGLRNRPFHEDIYLRPLRERIESGKNPTDRAVEAFKKGRREFLSFVTY